MKKLFAFIKTKTSTAYAALVALSVSLMVPSLARADEITDAIKDFDTSNILAAGAAIIALVITIVGIRKVIQMLKGG